MTDADSKSDAACCELPDLVGLVRSRLLLVGGMALGFLIAAVVMMMVRGPVYDATAFLEVEEPAEIATIEAKLKFPSLYRNVAESDDAARDLAQRTRLKNPRGSRIVAVTVRHSEPEMAAAGVNALAEAFVCPSGEAATADKPAPDGIEADSLATLAETWETVTEEFEKLSKRYQDEAEHPAVVGARERREAVAKRIREQVGVASDNDLGEQLKGLLQSSRQARGKAEANSSETLVRLVEPAVIPQLPVGPSRFLILAGAVFLGVFSGVILALCGCCRSRKK